MNIMLVEKGNWLKHIHIALIENITLGGTTIYLYIYLHIYMYLWKYLSVYMFMVYIYYYRSCKMNIYNNDMTHFHHGIPFVAFSPVCADYDGYWKEKIVIIKRIYVLYMY